MTIRTGQCVYRVQGPDGRWVQKTGNIRTLKWVENQDKATFWRKLHHLKSSVREGIFANPDNLEGVPLAALKVIEYEVTIERTGRKRRLTEIDRFKKEEEEKCKHENVAEEFPGEFFCYDCGESP